MVVRNSYLKSTDVKSPGKYPGLFFTTEFYSLKSMEADCRISTTMLPAERIPDKATAVEAVATDFYQVY